MVDTHVNLDPSAEQLGGNHRARRRSTRAFGLEPKVALLSHSNFGSSDAPSALEDARGFGAVAREACRTLTVDGEMHGDCALDEAARAAVLPDSTLQGSANLLVCPNMDSANIAYNLLKSAAGHNVAIGPILLGCAAPAHILTGGHRASHRQHDCSDRGGRQPGESVAALRASASAPKGPAEAPSPRAHVPLHIAGQAVKIEVAVQARDELTARGADQLRATLHYTASHQNTARRGGEHHGMQQLAESVRGDAPDRMIGGGPDPPACRCARRWPGPRRDLPRGRRDTGRLPARYLPACVRCASARARGGRSRAQGGRPPSIPRRFRCRR